jgi:hypothetical protein
MFATHIIPSDNFKKWQALEDDSKLKNTKKFSSLFKYEMGALVNKVKPGGSLAMKIQLECS